MRKYSLLVFCWFLASCGESLNDQLGSNSNIATQPLQACQSFCQQQKNQFYRAESGYSYLSFPNFGFRGIGRCRGHALVTQRFSLLARYDDSVGSCPLNLQTCLGSIKRGIDSIMQYQSHTFEGFSDLYDLSSVPEISAYLKSYVRGISHRYSAVAAQIEVNEYKNEFMNIFYELKRRVLLNQLPYVGVYGKITGSHALLVYAFKQDKRDLLCVRDPNIVLGSSENCDHKIYHDGIDVFYQRYDRQPDRLSSFSLTSDEDVRVSRFSAVLYDQCLREASARGDCK